MALNLPNITRNMARCHWAPAEKRSIYHPLKTCQFIRSIPVWPPFRSSTEAALIRLAISSVCAGTSPPAALISSLCTLPASLEGLSGSAINLPFLTTCKYIFHGPRRCCECISFHSHRSLRKVFQTNNALKLAAQCLQVSRRLSLWAFFIYGTLSFESSRFWMLTITMFKLLFPGPQQSKPTLAFTSFLERWLPFSFQVKISRFNVASFFHFTKLVTKPCFLL